MRNVLRTVVKKTTAEPFVYYSGGDQIEINATLTSPDPVLLSAAGVDAEGAEHFDLLVDPSEMVVAGETREPVKGDMVEFPQAGDAPSRRFALVHRGDSEFCFRRTDGVEMLWRLYLVEIEAESAIPGDRDADLDEEGEEDLDG